MIFLTVGTQLPFDRLVRAVDDWAARNPGYEIFGQIADPGPDGHRPAHFAWTEHLDPGAFEHRFAAATCIVGHAGMGTIIGALGRGKPLLMLARRAHLKEQRNDHQQATALRFGSKPGITVAAGAEEIPPSLDRLVSGAGSGSDPIAPFAQERLVAAVRSMIG